MIRYFMHPADALLRFFWFCFDRFGRFGLVQRAPYHLRKRFVRHRGDHAPRLADPAAELFYLDQFDVAVFANIAVFVLRVVRGGAIDQRNLCVFGSEQLLGHKISGLESARLHREPDRATQFAVHVPDIAQTVRAVCRKSPAQSSSQAHVPARGT